MLKIAKNYCHLIPKIAKTWLKIIISGHSDYRQRGVDICEDGICVRKFVSVHDETRIYEIQPYVGMVVPKHLGGATFIYEVCYGSKGCQNVGVALFGINAYKNTNTIDMPINSENFKIAQGKIVDGLDGYGNDEATWSSLELLQGSSPVPDNTPPPFILIQITNGKESMLSLIHI